MTYNINELIDFNINLVNKGSDVRKLELKGIDNKTLNDEMCLTLFEKLRSESLIDTDDYNRIILSARAYEIINYGGWVKHIIDIENKKIELDNRNIIKENLEIALAKSNLEANKLNKKIADRNKKNEKQNRISTWINIGIGIINVCLLVWQISKTE